MTVGDVTRHDKLSEEAICDHRGGFIKAIKITGRGCSRRRGLYHCDLHGLCVPFMPREKGFYCCERCEDRT